MDLRRLRNGLRSRLQHVPITKRLIKTSVNLKHTLQRMKARLDAFLNNFISKKLSVFVVACIGLFSGTLNSGDWVTIAAVYIGTQGVIDAVSKLRSNK